MLVDDGHGTLVVDNDQTVELYCKMAVSQARAGAHRFASGMMDGQIAAMRAALDEAGFEDVCRLWRIRRSTLRRSSARSVTRWSRPSRGDRKTYQQDPANRRDVGAGGARRPGGGRRHGHGEARRRYLDIVREVAEFSPVPVAAYQVSGEYAMIEAAAANGWIARKAVVLESSRSIHRAGADVILTYYGTEAARWLASWTPNTPGIFISKDSFESHVLVASKHMWLFAVLPVCLYCAF